MWALWLGITMYSILYSVIIFAKMFRNGSEVQKCTAMEVSDGKIFEVMTSTYPLLDINILSQFPSVFHLPGSLNMSVLLVAPFTFAVWFKKNSIWRLNNPTLLKKWKQSCVESPSIRLWINHFLIWAGDGVSESGVWLLVRTSFT